jgi:hypothetical protein
MAVVAEQEVMQSQEMAEVEVLVVVLLMLEVVRHRQLVELKQLQPSGPMLFLEQEQQFPVEEAMPLVVVQ